MWGEGGCGAVTLASQRCLLSNYIGNIYEDFVFREAIEMKGAAPPNHAVCKTEAGRPAERRATEPQGEHLAGARCPVIFQMAKAKMLQAAVELSDDFHKVGVGSNDGAKVIRENIF